MTLDHDDLILLARLLGNHTNGPARSKLGRLNDKLMNYADRTISGGRYALEPLDLALNPCPLYPKRVIFYEKLKA